MKEAVNEKATAALWWTGWRPLVVASVGGVVGVLAGYAAGELGPATTVIGVVLISAGVFLSTLRRIGFLSAVVAFFVFYVIGPDRAERALEGSGVGADWTDVVAESVLNIGALVGVETTREPTTVVGGGVASLSLWSLAGAALGGVVWIAGVYVVNARYSDVYHRFVNDVKGEGSILLGDDGFHTFVHGEETAPVARSAKKYHATNLLIGDSSLSLHHGSTVDMVRREEEISDSTKELYYDQVASVDYEEPFLKIRMSDGQVVKIVTSGKPVGVIEEIEDHLRRYKTSDDRTEGERREFSEEETGDERDEEKNDEDHDRRTRETDTSSDDGERAGADETGASEIDAGVMDEVDEALDAFDEAMRDEEGEDATDDVLGAFDETIRQDADEDEEG